jgi:hypothetical protein
LAHASRALVAGLLWLAFATLGASAQVGTPYCFGNACPCGNDDPTAGCGNAGFDGNAATGALLAAISGSADIGLDDLHLRASGIKAGQFGLIVMADAQVNVVLGDGRRCVGAGANGLFRFAALQADANGHLDATGIVADSQNFAAAGQIVAGATWNFQAWYRDQGGPCGTEVNWSNALPVTFQAPLPLGIEAQLVGEPLSEYPYFDYVRAFNEGEDLHLALDPTRFPSAFTGVSNVYIVAAKTNAEWTLDKTLSDVRGTPSIIDLAGPDIQTSTFLIDAGTLPGTSGTQLGIAYDIVIDLDGDGLLGLADVIDGLGDEAGMYTVRDTVAPGPHAVTEALYSGGTWLGQDLYYPSDIANLGQLPLIVVSHGNGHNYQWYDHIGYHMASYGYVVMSHQNNTVPGPGAASLTTLDNTDYLLGNLGAIEGGALAGHIDGHRIVWIGHSRGGEGVARAYDRLFDGTSTPINYTIDDIKFVSSIAPTDFLGTDSSNPHAVPYLLWTGSADGDVNGGPSSDVVQTYHLLERAEGTRLSITLQGVGHGSFHDGGGSTVATGPCQVGRVKTHKLMKGYFLPAVRHVLDGNFAAEDFLYRQWEAFKPIGHPPLDPQCTVVNYEYRQGPAATKLVLDDFQSEPSELTSSSGGPVQFTVSNVSEGLLNDINTSFTWFMNDSMNGMTRGRPTDTTAGVVFDWVSAADYELELVAGTNDLSSFDWFSFRGCQATRHPQTIADVGNVTFAVTLLDGSGGASTIHIGAYGGGLTEPYARFGAGSGIGWMNEFESHRIRLSDFLTNGSNLDLTDISAVRFDFGGVGMSAQGRIGLDDIEFVQE